MSRSSTFPDDLIFLCYTIRTTVWVSLPHSAALSVYLNLLICWEKKVKVAQLCLTFCDPMDCIVHGILQARILEWVAFPFSRGSSQPKDQTQVSHIAGRFFTSWSPRKAQYGKAKVIQSCPTLCNIWMLLDLPLKTPPYIIVPNFHKRQVLVVCCCYNKSAQAESCRTTSLLDNPIVSMCPQSRVDRQSLCSGSHGHRATVLARSLGFLEKNLFLGSGCGQCLCLGGCGLRSTGLIYSF